MGRGGGTGGNGLRRQRRLLRRARQEGGRHVAGRLALRGDRRHRLLDGSVGEDELRRAVRRFGGGRSSLRCRGHLRQRGTRYPHPGSRRRRGSGGAGALTVDSHIPLDVELRDAYLARLGWTEMPAPTLETLFALHRAHVERIAYNTVWIALGERRTIDLASSVRFVAGGNGGY